MCARKKERQTNTQKILYIGESKNYKTLQNNLRFRQNLKLERCKILMDKNENSPQGQWYDIEELLGRKEGKK